MVSVDISNVWGALSLPDLLGVEKDISDAHQRLLGELPDTAVPGWMAIPEADSEEVLRIQEAAERICASSDVCVVVGMGGAVLGARAAMDLLQGVNRNFGRGRGNPQIFFTGQSLSSRHWNELLRLLEGKDFSVIAVSKSGATLESAIALRGLRWTLERRCGTKEAARRIFAVTDGESGPLLDMARFAGWETFAIPTDIQSPFSVFTAAGLLPMAVAGIDIQQLLRGGKDAMTAYDLRSFENPLWLCAGVRCALQRQGTYTQILSGFEPGFRSFGRWWQNLFAWGEGRGMLPLGGEYPADLHTLGPVIQLSPGNVLETLLRFDSPETGHTIGSEINDAGGLNYLAGKQLDEVEEQAFQAAISAHADAGVPVITVECGQLCESTLGKLFGFWQQCCCLCALATGEDPDSQAGMEPYYTELNALLEQSTAAEL